VWLADLFGKPQKQLARGEAATIEFKCGEIVTLLATKSAQHPKLLGRGDCDVCGPLRP
jgi:hypothetical protein